MTSIVTALTAARPIIAPIEEVSQMPPNAGALCAGSTAAWTAMKTPETTMPVPKPPGMMYSDSQMLVWPCHRRRSSKYDDAEISVASINNCLYFPVLNQSVSRHAPTSKERTYFLISMPETIAPTALPATAGKRYAPATVFDALSVTWKYSGTANINPS